MSIYDDRPKKERLDGVYRGKFANSPTILSEKAMVIIPTIGGPNFRFGPMPWNPWRDDRQPVRGNPCLVAYDEHENPYVISWWTDDEMAAPGD